MAPRSGLGFLGRTSERRSIDAALARARDGQTAVLVFRGAPGIGKTALLRYAARQASGLRLAQVEGVQAEIELPFSGIHRLCAPLFDSLDKLPGPQQDALRVTMGMSTGETPDRFLVAVAILNLLATTAVSRPLLCLVDDAQWLDATSLEVLGFVARRLDADPVAILFGLRQPVVTLALDGLPQLALEGLAEPDAHALLRRAVPGPLDERVRDRIVGETRGNPLALVELSQSMSPAERAGGFAPPSPSDLPGRLTREYQRRVAALPEPTQQLMLLAAAEPLGDASVLWRAADRLSIEPTALGPATVSGLLEVDDRIRFSHPLVRAAVYGAASDDERRLAHGALAEACDPEIDADSRAWHRALAAVGPDEEVAAELERCAGRAEGRGGLAAAAALLERATVLTPDPARQAERALAAAEASFQAGDFQATQLMLATAQSGGLDDFHTAQAALLRGHAEAVSRYGNDAAAMLLEAARSLEAFDVSLARRAFLIAWSAAVTAQHLGGKEVLLELSRAVLALPPLPPDAHPLDRTINGFALLVTDGHAAAMPALRRAAREVLELPVKDVIRWGWQVGGVRSAIWDDDAIEVYERQVKVVRDEGALAELPIHLQALALEQAWRGDLSSAQRLTAEAESIATATGNDVPPFAMLRILALQGREADASPLIEHVVREGTKHGQGIAVMVAHWAAAVLNNGLGRFDRAAAAAHEVVADGILPWLRMWAAYELVEATVRVGDEEAARGALDALMVTTQPADSCLARGIEARSRALLAGGEAQELYLEAITQLERSRNRSELARAHLVFGEWLLDHSRLREARERLRVAGDLFAEIGMDGFAERASAGLAAAGAKPRARSNDVPVASHDLTPQEGQIARMARDGLTNTEIGAQLFLSPRTVEWHLHKAFAKLRIESRDKLDDVLPAEERARA
jgi:DNA-binding CsgD family transcriptional regulator